MESLLTGIRQFDFNKWILAILLALYPLLVIPCWPGLRLGLYPVDCFYMPRFLFLMVLSSMALIGLVKNNGLLRQRFLWPLGLFILLALISVSLAAYPLTAWIGAPYRYTGFLSYICCFILLLTAARAGNSRDLQVVMVYGAAIVSVLAILQVLGWNLVPHERFREGLTAYATMGNPDFLGAYAAFLLPAAIALYINRPLPTRLLAVTLILAGLLASFAWGAWVGALLGVIVIFLLSFNKESRPAWFKLTLVLAAGIIIFAVIDFHWGLHAQVGWVNPEERLKNISDALRFLPACWAFGVGPDHLVHVIRMLPLASLLDKTPSLYLEMALTLGIPALLSYLVFGGLFLWDYRRHLARNWGFAGMITVYLVQGLFQFETIVLMPLFWAVLGMVIASESGYGPEARMETLPGSGMKNGFGTAGHDLTEGC